MSVGLSSIDTRNLLLNYLTEVAPNLAHPYFVLMTCYYDNYEIPEHGDAFDDVISKPIFKNDLLRLLRKAQKMKQISQE